MNSEYRRILKRLPEDVVSILNGLNGEYVVGSYAPQYMGWLLEITVGLRRFRLVKEWHQVFIAEIDGDKKINFWPSIGQTENLGIDKAAEVINGRIA